MLSANNAEHCFAHDHDHGRMAAQLLHDDPQKALALLKFAAQFPDFPKNFVPPALVDPTYVPPSRSRPLEILCYAITVVSTATVVLRLCVRRRGSGKRFGVDDWLTIPSQVSNAGNNLQCALLTAFVL